MIPPLLADAAALPTDAAELAAVTVGALCSVIAAYNEVETKVPTKTAVLSCGKHINVHKNTTQ